MSGPLAPPGSWVGADAVRGLRGPVEPTRRAAVPRLARRPRQGRRWLDVGCGTGALSQAILAAADPAEVVGVDPSLPFVAHAAAQVPDPRAAFRNGDAERLPVDNGSFDAVVSGLVLNFVPDQRAALREMRRAARPGGIVAAYVWDYAGRHAADGALLGRRRRGGSRGAAHCDEGLRFPLCRPDPLRELFCGAGLADVAVEEIVVPTVFADFDDYWSPFLGGQGPAPAYAMSLAEEDRGGAARAAARPPPRRGRRLDPAHRPRVGGARLARAVLTAAGTRRPTSTAPASTGGPPVHRCRRAVPQVGALPEGRAQTGTAPVARSAQQPRGAP